MVWPILTERRRVDDSWAYQTEYELRQLIARAGLDQPPRSARVFCNAHGCLAYLEGRIYGGLIGSITLPLYEAPWAIELGIASTQHYLFTGSGWLLVIVRRPVGTSIKPIADK